MGTYCVLSPPGSMSTSFELTLDIIEVEQRVEFLIGYVSASMCISDCQYGGRYGVVALCRFIASNGSYDVLHDRPHPGFLDKFPTMVKYLECLNKIWKDAMSTNNCIQ